MIFNQWNRGQCQWYAFLAALYILDPSIDYAKIDKELQEVWDLAYPWKAGAWFQEKGYISSYEAIEPIQMKALLNRNIPLITGSRFWDFLSIKDPDYLLSFNKDNKMFQHKYIIVSEDNGILKCQNSWGEQFWQDGYFYIDLKDRVFLDAMWRIEPVKKNKHNEVIKKWMGKNYIEPWMNTAECVAWSKKYCQEMGYPISSFSWSAHAWWVTWSPFNNTWKRVVYKSGMFPPEWSILFWNENRCKNGHTAVANEFCNENVLRYTDQNWTGHYDIIQARFTDYKNLSGWFERI